MGTRIVRGRCARPDVQHLARATRTIVNRVVADLGRAPVLPVLERTRAHAADIRLNLRVRRRCEDEVGNIGHTVFERVARVRLHRLPVRIVAEG